MKKLAIMSLLTLLLVILKGGSVQAHTISNFTETAVSGIQASESVSAADLEKIYAGYYCIPENVRNRMEADHVEVYLVDMSNEVLTYSGSTIRGLYYGATRYISPEGAFLSRAGDSFIDIQTGRRKDPAETLLHETGHLIADLGGNSYPYTVQAKTPEMECLYGAYAPVVASYDATSALNCYNKDEMFAESFRIFIQDPEWLSESCPELFTYIACCVEIYAGGSF